MVGHGFEGAGGRGIDHKGERCIYLEGPAICQEGRCSNCMIHKKRQVR